MNCKYCSCCKKGYFAENPYKNVCTGVKEPFEIYNLNAECTQYPREYWNEKLKDSVTYIKVSFQEMLETEVSDILNGYKTGGITWYWRNDEDDFLEITELDLLRRRFITEGGDFSEFEWELENSRIYVKQG